MDSKDEQILDILTENSNLTTRKISKKTRIPITTVHHRIKKLKNEGIIKNYTINVDHKKLGKEIGAFVLVDSDVDKLQELKIDQHEIAKRLRKLDYVESADNVTGATDILLKVRVKDMEELDNFIITRLRKFEGVAATKTMVILREN